VQTFSVGAARQTVVRPARQPQRLQFLESAVRWHWLSGVVSLILALLAVALFLTVDRRVDFAAIAAERFMSVAASASSRHAAIAPKPVPALSQSTNPQQPSYAPEMPLPNRAPAVSKEPPNDPAAPETIRHLVKLDLLLDQQIDALNKDLRAAAQAPESSDDTAASSATQRKRRTQLVLTKAIVEAKLQVTRASTDPRNISQASAPPVVPGSSRVSQLERPATRPAVSAIGNQKFTKLLRDDGRLVKISLACILPVLCSLAVMLHFERKDRRIRTERQLRQVMDEKALFLAHIPRMQIH
jgi:hypothetical protein